MLPSKFHRFNKSVTGISLPQQFTFPFHYTPHPLCVLAANQVQEYLVEQKQWETELKEGKMFGVLLVQAGSEEVGFLSAFSGNLAGKNEHTYFVPPIYDLLQPDGFFRLEEDQISAINKKIKEILSSKSYLSNKRHLQEEITCRQAALDKAKDERNKAKEDREKRRENNPDSEELATLIRESQFQKAEFKRLKQEWESRIIAIETKINIADSEIEALRIERKTRSAALQTKLFEQFRILNAMGEMKDLPSLFEATSQKVPPSGAGECAAPKLLQHAYQNHLKPLAMAEFWWGNSPKAEIRHHGYFYPACKGKCEPILQHMLKGLDVEENTLLKNLHRETKLEIVFEDDWILVVNKPAGLLSVPGKSAVDSVYNQVKTLYPKATGPLLVHRLDMATSGLLLVAKTKEVHQNLQAQFKNRTIQKRYIALLDGIIIPSSGRIELPVRLDPNDRPRQVVDEIHGKPTITEYLVLSVSHNQTRIAFHPLTGRTHQLRIHAAHPLGLNAPIAGDELYGKKADRLFLHAESLTFQHPISGKIIQIEKKSEF